MASSASMKPPVKSSSFALRAPNSHVCRGTRPRTDAQRSTGSPNRASSAAMIRSHGQHSISPAATHAPWTAAIEGFGMSRHVRQ